MIDAYNERYHKHPNLEMIIAGRIEAMILKYKLLSDYNIGSRAILQDKYHNKFQIEEKNNLTYIYHFEDLQIQDYEKFYDLGINYLRF